MTKILDQFGNPIESSQLKDKQSDQVSKIAGLHTQFATHPSRGLTPAKLARILEQAEQGDITAQHELFLDMEEKDGHIYAEMSKRKRALLTLDWSIKPPRNASAAEIKQAEYVEEVFQDIDNLEDLMLDMLDAIGHGFSGIEIEWELLAGEWLPKAFHQRPQQWFQLDRETRSKLRLRDNSADGADLWPFGWIIHVHKAKSGYIARSGLHRVLAWPFLFKNYSIRDLAEFLEIYGLPLRIGTYPNGANDDEKLTLLRAVTSIGHDAAGIIPEGMMLDFKEAAKGACDPFQYMVELMERTQSKAILGGTLTSQADGKSSTNALGNVHNEVRHDLLQSDARQLASTLTRDLVYMILALNKGAVSDRRRLPRFVFDTMEAEDMALYADALPKLVGIGMRIPSSYAHEKLRIPQAEVNEEILRTANPAPSSPATNETAATAALTSQQDPAAQQDQDEFDVLVDELASDWERVTDPLVAPIVALAAEVESFEEFQARLPELIQGMDPTALAEALSQGQFAARVWGRVNATDQA